MYDKNEVENNVKSLIAHLSCTDNMRTKLKNQLVMLDYNDQNVCVILHEGIVSAYRPIDDLLIRNLNAPIVLGLNFFYEESLFYLRAFTSIKYEIVDLSHAREIIDQKNLWKVVTLHQMHISARMMDDLSCLSGVPTHDLILHCLNKLEREPDVIKSSRTAADYIIEKTHLSRSTVMKTLALLKRDGAIKLKKGLLAE